MRAGELKGILSPQRFGFLCSVDTCKPSGKIFITFEIQISGSRVVSLPEIWITCFFFLIRSRFPVMSGGDFDMVMQDHEGIMGTLAYFVHHLGSVCFDLISCDFVLGCCWDRPLDFPIAGHDFLIIGLQASWQNLTNCLLKQYNCVYHW